MNEMKKISIFDLEIPRFQRGIKPAHPIKGNYDERLEGSGTAALYKGKYHLLDGLQRTSYKAKAIADGRDDLTPEMWFSVILNPTFEEMIDVFIRINKARAGMAAYDLHKAGVIGGQEVHVTLEKLAARHGLRVGPLKAKDGSVLTVISPLITAIERGRGTDVEEALSVLTEAFPQQTIDNRVVVGYIDYLQDARTAGGRSPRVSDREYIVQKLQSKFRSMGGLKSAGLQRASESNSSEYTGVAKALETALGLTRAKRVAKAEKG